MIANCLRDNTPDVISDPDYLQYHGQVSITYYEQLGDLSVRRKRAYFPDINADMLFGSLDNEDAHPLSERYILRPVDVELLFSLRFPLTATVNSTSQTLSQTQVNLTVDQAIVLKEMTLFVPRTGSYGMIILATLTKRPHKLLDPYIVNTVADLTPTIEAGSNATKYVTHDSKPI